MGDEVRIEERHFNEGLNDVRLVVRKGDGSSEEVSITINLERDEPTTSSTPTSDTPDIGT